MVINEGPVDVGRRVYWDGTVTGGGARRQVQPQSDPSVQGPADKGQAGPLRGEYYSVGSSGLGAGKGLGSKSSLPAGISNTLPSAAKICFVSILPRLQE